MRLAHMNSSLHGSCKFNKFYLIHANKRRAMQSHYSVSSNYYQYILVLTTDDEHDFILEKKELLTTMTRLRLELLVRL